MKRALVTGGGGFLGRAIVEELLGEGVEVTCASRSVYPELERLGARSVALDLAHASAEAVAAVVAGHDSVFHVAAKAGVWGPYREYYAANVLGTQRVLAACRASGARRLVHTSSPSVCFDGGDHVDASNDLPLSTSFLCAYPATKAQAERDVLAANNAELATCALRPHLIIGPRDPHLVPRLAERARQGRLAIVGSGRNVVSLTDVENAAVAHVAAARSLAPGAAHAGRAYFIGQREPVVLWDWIGALLRELDLPPVTRRVPAAVAYAGGAAMETLWRVLRRQSEPPMTRFVARQLATSHSYSLTPAERDFGYRERHDLAAATRRAVEGARAT